MGRVSSFTIGRVTGVHGLGGNLKVWSYAESVETFSPGKSVLLKSEDDSRELKSTILRAQPHKKGVLLALEGVENRNQAEDLIGFSILMDRQQLEEPETDSWYWEDLYGMKVLDEERGFIGRIDKIFPTGANDVLVVKDGKKETLVPMHRQFVVSVDIEANVLKTTLPEDL